VKKIITTWKGRRRDFRNAFPGEAREQKKGMGEGRGSRPEDKGGDNREPIVPGRGKCVGLKRTGTKLYRRRKDEERRRRRPTY